MNAEDQHEKVKDDSKQRDPLKGFDSDSAEDEEDFGGIEVNLAQIDEKAAAVNAMGIICMNSPKLTMTRSKDILEAMENLHHYFHENVKFHVVQAYNQIILGMMRAAGVMDADDKFNWTKGPSAGSPLPSDVMAFVDRIVFPYFY